MGNSSFSPVLIPSVSEQAKSRKGEEEYHKLLLQANTKGGKKFSNKQVAEILEATPGFPDEALLYNPEFVGAHIFTKTINSQTTLMRLWQVLQHLMIRCFQASSIPLGTGRRIGADIPPMVKHIENPEFKKEEAEAYHAHDSIHRCHLFIRDEERPERIH
ncbi:uncharacterized protein BO87DRAFT_453161 [Aspergillus neoniger CBS 115656]|uniref:Uncharacterized protein n=1 Tax=Aspergillus neoniger (strain CBS 115656) TaxID=1448310 RepID=A0A318Y426_ASPNB|nr:hypothetical protein BO87DRAFT_453161 [Aspergillus neoniger CBS 115656]PYH28207.1 hypothetical protein BO87DRAFT_453161 [Aspergillus neoniger CBS 115656]